MKKIAASPTLAQIQRWFLEAISHPSGVQAGNATIDASTHLTFAEDHITDLVTASKKLTAWERLGIYNQAYFARLLECMQEEYPMVRHTVGDDLFHDFALSYLQQHPPSSYSLYHLGTHFPKFLLAQRPVKSLSSEIDWADFIIDLADYEWQLNEVFDGPGMEMLSPLDLTRLANQQSHELPLLRFRPVSCLRLLEYRFPVHRYFSAIRNSQVTDPPTANPTHLAITRRNYKVEHYEMCRPAWMLLTQLVAGATLGESMEHLLSNEQDHPELENRIFEWFRDWMSLGFFASCE
jgi:hypothetical protein